MDQLHRRLARLALAEAGAFGFCLAGGYAVQAHGFLDRPSKDVDLFTTTASEEHFSDALAAVVRAYKADRLDVTMTMANPGFARFQVTDPTTGTTAKVELGIDWRAHPPVTLAIGPVLHPDDAVANKVCALYSRAQARDFIDVDAILRSGRYTGDELLALAKEHDPGFDEDMFVLALRAIRRLPVAEFIPYKVKNGRGARRSTSAKVASPPSPEHCDPSEGPCATSTITSTSSAEPSAEARVRSGQVPRTQDYPTSIRLPSRPARSVLPACAQAPGSAAVHDAEPRRSQLVERTRDVVSNRVEATSRAVDTPFRDRWYLPMRKPEWEFTSA